MSHPESGMYLQAVPDTDGADDSTTPTRPATSRDGKSRPAAPSPFAPPRTSPSSGDQDQDQTPGSTKPTKPTPAAEPVNNTGGQGQGTPAAPTAAPATGGQNPTAGPTGTIPAPAAGPDNPARTTPGQASKTINDSQSTPDPNGDAARAKPAANGKGTGNGAGDPAGAGQAPQIDPSKMLSLATPAITALSTIPQLALTMPLSLLGALTAPLSAILAQFGKGTPSTPAQSTLPAAANANLQQAATGTSNWNGTGAGAHTTANQTGQNKTQALGTLDAKLKALLEKSGDKTSEGRQKVEGIINQVNTSLQALGPVANTPAGQAQILSTLTTAIQQAGAVLADSSSSSGGNAAELQSIATQYLTDTASAATTSPTALVQGASLTGDSPLAKLTANSSREEVARAIIAEAQRRGYSPEQTVAILSTAMRESNLVMQDGGGGAWHGFFQQDESYPNRDNPGGNIQGFFDRLDAKIQSGGGSQDMFKNIFWLQQRPGESSADIAFANGRQDYLNEIQIPYANAVSMYNAIVGNGGVQT